MRSKPHMTLLIAAAILLFSVYNALDDHLNTDSHEQFFREVRDFMHRGDRNTAEMGYTTCYIQNMHSKTLGLRMRDCCTAYFPNKPEYCERINERIFTP